jgi:hypothetical protein
MRKPKLSKPGKELRSCTECGNKVPCVVHLDDGSLCLRCYALLWGKNGKKSDDLR